MKKLFAALIAVMLLLTACGAQNQPEDSTLHSEGPAAQSQVSAEPEPETDSTEEPQEESENSAPDDEIRPAFRQAMDAYEEFYEEYCELLKEYKENPTDLGLLAEYGDMLAQTEKVDQAFEEWNEDELNSAELQYYLEVSSRVLKMMADIAV